MEKVTALLREKGFKVTPQRLAIYSVLAASKAHPSAEMIFKQLQPIYPTMSLATVYKTIEILKEIELIQVLNAGEDCFRYDANVKNHPHIRCMKCGRVDDLDNIDSSAFVADIEKHTEYQITGQQFYFYGICPECRKSK